MEIWYTLDVNSTLDFLSEEFIEVTPIFLRHRIDFCARGSETLAEVCRSDGLDLKRIVIEMEAEIEGGVAGIPNLAALSVAQVIEYLVGTHHRTQRLDLSAVATVARSVERRHQGEDWCPQGLTELLERTRDQACEHMDRKEQAIYPAFQTANSESERAAAVAALSSAREADRAALDDIRVFTRDFSLPAGACLEWRALNTTLRNLDVDLFNQAHVEDRYLFPRAPVG